ncbi:MAG: APC family permease [Bacillota bacterium]|nr:APC family permease [Bacillota bacterium]
MNEQKSNTGKQLKQHDISMLTVFFMIFCMVCAGAYGIEDMIPAAGPGLTLLLLIVLPFFWSIPQGLIAAELGSAIPEEGGYYKWVQRALGEFWGFQAGWWRTLSIYVDSTLYVVLATGYLGAFIALTPLQEFLFKLVFILVFVYINIRGLTDVGRIAAYFSVLVMATFIILTVVGFANWNTNPFLPFIPEGQTVMGSIGLGVAICMWMYAGYESMSTVAGEVKNPQVIPKATLLSIPAIMLFYILPTMAGLSSVGNWQQWGTAGGISFATVAGMIGIPMFALLFVVAAIISNASLYNTYLASGSRGFYAMSEDHLAPRFFADISGKYGTPHKAILSMAVVNLILCQYGFDVLVVIDVFLLMFAYILIYVSAIVLRIKEPDLPRGFRIPFGTRGLIVFCIPPTILAVIALFTNGLLYFIGGCIGILSGPIAYYFCKRIYGGLDMTHVIDKKDKRNIAVASAVMVVFIAVAGFMVASERQNAHQALNEFAAPLFSAQEYDTFYDFGEELYGISLAGHPQYSIYYDEGFFATIDLGQKFDDENAFAAAALSELQQLAALAPDVEYVDIYADNYLLYGAEYGAYSSIEQMAADVGKAY